MEKPKSRRYGEALQQPVREMAVWPSSQPWHAKETETRADNCGKRKVTPARNVNGKRIYNRHYVEPPWLNGRAGLS